MSSSLQPHKCSTPGFPVPHYLPQLAQTHVHQVGDAIQPSHLVIPFSSCLQSFPASESSPMSWPFASGGQSIGASASAWVPPINIQGWFVKNRFLSCWSHCVSGPLCYRGLAFTLTNTMGFMTVFSICLDSRFSSNFQSHDTDTSFLIPSTGLKLVFVSTPSHQSPRLSFLCLLCSDLQPRGLVWGKN